MATLNLQVGASTDDARNISSDGTFNATVVAQHIGINSSVDYWNGWRFTGVTIPNAATITSAVLNLYSSGTGTGTTALAKFFGEAADNPATFSNSTALKPEGRTRTTAYVTKSFTVANWAATGFDKEYVDVTSLVQEIVNRGGWASGNSLVLVAHDNGSSNNNYIGHSTYDSASSRGAKLSITYTSGVVPADPSGFTATQSGSVINLAWTDNSSNETGFEIQRKRGGSSNYYTIATTAANTTSYVDADVDAGYAYTYRLRAITASAFSAWVSDSETMSGTKKWTSYIEAWFYPGPPAENADEEYSDGRVLWALKPEYHTMNASGVLVELDDPADGQNAYNTANIADIKTYSGEQYDTVSSNRANMATMLADSTKKTNAINTLVSFCTTTGITGVALDFEGYGTWSASDWTNYKAWVTTLGAALHAAGKKLEVAGPPITNSTEQGYYPWKYEDFESIPEVDYICMMIYDYQYDYGAGASVQPASWAQAGCNWIRSKISDVNRIIMGLPSYGYHGTTGGYTITIDTKAQSAGYTGYAGATRNADGEMTWTNGGNSYVYQDSTGMNTKRERIEDEGIRRISVWHLGGNDWFTGKSEISASGIIYSDTVVTYSSATYTYNGDTAAGTTTSTTSTTTSSTSSTSTTTSSSSSTTSSSTSTTTTSSTSTSTTSTSTTSTSTTTSTSSTSSSSTSTSSTSTSSTSTSTTSTSTSSTSSSTTSTSTTTTTTTLRPFMRVPKRGRVAKAKTTF